MFYVNGIAFDLNYEKPNSRKLMRSNGTYALGCTDLNIHKVYINNKLKGKMFDKVLCHELVHCFCLAYNYILDVQTEEICADFLSTYGREVFNVADDILSRMVGVKYG